MTTNYRLLSTNLHSSAYSKFLYYTGCIAADKKVNEFNPTNFKSPPSQKNGV